MPTPHPPPTPNAAHAPRPRFDSLFAEPRHYRGDCRLMRTAIRRGWLNDAPQDVRDALLARFSAAVLARRPDAGHNIRATLAECYAAIEVEAANIRESAAVLRCCWAGKWVGYTTGRPRERWHVDDHPNRIDARELTRRTLREGGDLSTVAAVVVTFTNPDTGTPREHRVRAELTPGSVGGPRLALVCPVCGGLRVYLFAALRGVGCRRCARVMYADRRARSEGMGR